MDTSLIGALTNFGALGLIVFFIMIGWLIPKPFYSKLEEENRLLREAATTDRKRGDEAEETGRITHQLITALTQVATDAGRGGQAIQLGVNAARDRKAVYDAGRDSDAAAVHEASP